MAKYIKEVKIGFENCEVIKLPTEAFENLLIQDIEQEVYRFACNAIGKFTKGEIYFCLFKAADREHRVFEDCEDVTTVFKRIGNGCDITDVELIYEDGTTEDIYAKWDGESEYFNINQHSKITDRGDLKVYIGRNWNNKDYELIKAYWHEIEDDERDFREGFFEDHKTEELKKESKDKEIAYKNKNDNNLVDDEFGNRISIEKATNTNIYLALQDVIRDLANNNSKDIRLEYAEKLNREMLHRLRGN